MTYALPSDYQGFPVRADERISPAGLTIEQAETVSDVEIFRLSILSRYPEWTETGNIPTCLEITMNLLGPYTIQPERGRIFNYNLANSILEHRLRRIFIRSCGFSIPSLEAFQEMERIQGRRPRIIEVGAGTGYWSRLMLARGYDVIATDKARRRNEYSLETGRHFPVRRMHGAQAVRKYADRDVFMSWPNYGEPFAYRVARLLSRGRLLVYVGESDSGCTGDDNFHALLRSDFEQIGYARIPQFYGINDEFRIYKRVRRSPIPPHRRNLW